MRLLVVCTANICRSPMAEGLLRARVGGRHMVESAGFLFDGRSAEKHAVRAMADRGVDISAHQSRIATPEMTGGADLVLTMERRHARDLAVLDPGSEARIHTLVTVAERLATRPEAIDPTIIEGWGAERDRAELLGSGPDDFPDPMGSSYRVFKKRAKQLDALVEVVARALP